MNPSAWRERIILAVLAGAGLCVSVYLGLYQLHVLGSVYDPVFGRRSSHAVLFSAFSKSLPVPDALLGAGNYAAEIVLDVLGGDDRWRGHPRLVAIFGVPLTVGALVSVALILMQAFVVGNFCALCLLSAGVSIVIFLVGLREVIAAARVLRARHTGHE
jgi:uncharacterized membrane protein